MGHADDRPFFMSHLQRMPSYAVLQAQEAAWRAANGGLPNMWIGSDTTHRPPSDERLKAGRQMDEEAEGRIRYLVDRLSVEGCEPELEAGIHWGLDSRKATLRERLHNGGKTRSVNSAWKTWFYPTGPNRGFDPRVIVLRWDDRPGNTSPNGFHPLRNGTFELDVYDESMKIGRWPAVRLGAFARSKGVKLDPWPAEEAWHKG